MVAVSSDSLTVVELPPQQLNLSLQKHLELLLLTESSRHERRYKRSIAVLLPSDRFRSIAVWEFLSQSGNDNLEEFNR